jgi:hypothetical protein
MEASSICIMAGHWPVRTVICFSCSCKAAAQVCKEQVLGNTAGSLLIGAVADAQAMFAAAHKVLAAWPLTDWEEPSATAAAARDYLQQQVAWIIMRAGQQILQGNVIPSLLQMPLQLELAVGLVGFGVRFTYAQLLAAVKSRAAAQHSCSAPGPYVWMAAYSLFEQDRPSDMPAIVEALCCGYDLKDEMLVSLAPVCQALLGCAPGTTCELDRVVPSRE